MTQRSSLFTIGQPPGRRSYWLIGLGVFVLLGLAWYLSTAAVVSAYGAAGSLVVLLMWIYFSSAVLLFSASCARAFEELGDGAPRSPRRADEVSG